MASRLSLRALVLLTATLWVASVANAQVADVRMVLAPEQIGIGGQVRAGFWNPVLVTLTNQSSKVRQVRIQLAFDDIDGDQVQAQRIVRALNPQRTEQFWVYAPIPATARTRDVFRLRLIDDESDRMLDTQRHELPELLPRNLRVIGLTGVDLIGLRGYATSHTHQEGTHVVAGLAPQMLPDRWHGLSPLEALVWTPSDLGGPTASDPSQMPRGSVVALRQWVQRGGHLVIVLPAVLETWTTSDLKDLLPAVEMTSLPGQPVPDWLGPSVLQRNSLRVPVRVLTPIPGVAQNSATILLRDAAGLPLVVACSVGLGRVTLIGVDLTNPDLTRAGLPTGDQLWRAVFGWRGPPMSLSQIETLIANQQMNKPEFRNYLALDTFIGNRISRTETIAPALFLAILVFGAYWLIAGPVSYAVLKRRNMVQHSWTAFVLTVAVFTVVAWGGASLLRPGVTDVRHMSVMDIDAATGLVRTQSWLALFVPEHGTVAVSLGDQVDGDNGAVALASPAGSAAIAALGTQAGLDEGGFLDPQAYTIDSASPDKLEVPIRATAKQLVLDYATRLDPRGEDEVSKIWLPPQGSISVDPNTGWLVGRLAHGLPGDLENVTFVYCPGENQEPWAWRHSGKWPPGQVITLDGQGPPGVQRLLLEPLPDPSGQPSDRWRGFLGDLKEKKPGESHDPLMAAPTNLGGDDQVVYAIEALTFFDALPFPNFRHVDWTQTRPIAFARNHGRRLDRSSRLALRGLLIIGHLPHSPLPAPLRVDGEKVHSEGWTTVRWWTGLE